MNKPYRTLSYLFLSSILMGCSAQPWQDESNQAASTGTDTVELISEVASVTASGRPEDTSSADSERNLTVGKGGEDGGGETISMLWGKFRTQISLPDPEHHVEDETGADSGALTAPAVDTGTLDHAPEANPEQTASPQTEVIVGDVPPADIWNRIRAGFRLPLDINRRVRQEAAWYSRHPAYIERTIRRAEPYLHYIVEALDRHQMPMEIALLPIVESAYQPFAFSHGRAAGLWQFIPGTAKLYGLKLNWWYDGRRDVIASTEAALTLLERLHKQFDGDWELALAAYNSGSGTVRKAVRKNRRKGQPTDFWSLKLPKETRAYVPKLLALKAIVAQPELYHVALTPVADEPYLATVEIRSQIDLALAADLANIELDEFYRLNPGYNRWATDPSGPQILALPVDKVEGFRERLAQLDEKDRIRWVRHRIRNGETLGHIARRYRTTLNVIKQVNNIKGNMIRAGKSLMIPVATRDLSDYRLSTSQRLSRIKSHRPAPGRVKLTHRVVKGDTFWDLAMKYHVTSAQIARWNGMSPKEFLRPGQRLVIWQKASRSAKSISRQATQFSGKNSNSTRRIRYVVRKGDSLARISHRFKVRISELRRWNDLPKGKYLQPGQRLTLFVDITKQSENI